MERNSGEQRVAAEWRGSDRELVEQELTGTVIGCFFDSYNSLGYGYLESVYCESLTRRLRRKGLHVWREAPLAVWDDGEPVGHFRADLLVERRLIVEVKAGPVLDPFAQRQLLNYLRCSDLEIGLVFHFGPRPRFHRLVDSSNRNRRRDRPA